jgi:hypothetical protein
LRTRSAAFSSLKFYEEGGRAGWIVRNSPQPRRDVCGISDPKILLHSIRHSFIEEARDTGVPEARREAIVGHAGDCVHAQYGRGAGLKVLADEVAKVDPLL